MAIFSVIVVTAPPPGQAAETGGPFVKIDGRESLLRCVELFLNRDNVKQIQIVFTAEAMEDAKRKFGPHLSFSGVKILTGGPKWVDQLAGIGREKQKSLLNYFLTILRENFVYNLKNSHLTFMSDQEEEFSKRFSPFINERNIVELTEVFEIAFAHIGMNGNPRIIFTDIAFKITKLIRK